MFIIINIIISSTKVGQLLNWNRFSNIVHYKYFHIQTLIISIVEVSIRIVLNL